MDSSSCCCAVFPPPLQSLFHCTLSAAHAAANAAAAGATPTSSSCCCWCPPCPLHTSPPPSTPSPPPPPPSSSASHLRPSHQHTNRLTLPSPALGPRRRHRQRPSHPPPQELRALALSRRVCAPPRFCQRAFPRENQRSPAAALRCALWVPRSHPATGIGTCRHKCQ